MEFNNLQELRSRTRYYLSWQFILKQGKIIKVKFKPMLKLKRSTYKDEDDT